MITATENKRRKQKENRLVSTRSSKSYADKKESKALLLLCLPAIIKVFIFSYTPMVGIIIAFQFYIPRKGLFNSEWVGFNNFKYLLESTLASRLIVNAVAINFLYIVIGTVVALALGLFLFEIANKVFVKVSQIIIIFPYFLSWPLIGVLLVALIGEDTGLLTNLLNNVFGYKINFYNQPQYWKPILTAFRTWKLAGFNAVVYYAILTGIDREYFEAAAIDGAGRFQRMFKISMPFLKLMIVINTIMSTANILRVDFNMVYFLSNNRAALYPAIDVIETYMFRALRTEGDYSIGTATGLLQGVVGLILTVITNRVSNKIAKESLF